MSHLNQHAGVLYISSKVTTIYECGQHGRKGRCIFYSGNCYCVHNGLLVADYMSGGKRHIVLRHWKLNALGHPCLESITLTNIQDVKQIFLHHTPDCRKYNQQPEILRGNTIGVAFTTGNKPDMKNGVFAFWNKQGDPAKYCDFKNGNGVVEKFRYYHYVLEAPMGGIPRLKYTFRDLDKPTKINSVHLNSPTAKLTC